MQDNHNLTNGHRTESHNNVVHDSSNRELQQLAVGDNYAFPSAETTSVLDLFDPLKRKVNDLRNKHALALGQEKIDSDLDTFGLVNAAKKVAIKEKLNSELQKGTTQLNREKAGFFAEQLAILTNTIYQKTDEFSQIHEKACTRHEARSDSLFKEREAEMLNNELNLFFQAMDRLRSDFQDSLDKQLKE